MKKFLSLSLLFVSLLGPAEGVSVEGGSLGCGKWLSARRSGASEQYEQYLVGVVSGLALGRWVDVWNAGGLAVSREQFFYWMDAYCQKNPLSMTITGAVDFSDERTKGEFKKKARQLR